ncbi:hypothetical protein GY45DRAFT_1317184 [Cubamyces sp. BRFM 1775]|nr:hypothetical protein GY45DRAFT_1317184 [Cubamyces sp. BRFM 1775]
MDKEFYVSVELYVSSKAAAALKKPPTSRKNAERRDLASRAASGSGDAAQKRVKGACVCAPLDACCGGCGRSDAY